MRKGKNGIVDCWNKGSMGHGGMKGSPPCPLYLFRFIPYKLFSRPTIDKRRWKYEWDF